VRGRLHGPNRSNRCVLAGGRAPRRGGPCRRGNPMPAGRRAAPTTSCRSKAPGVSHWELTPTQMDSRDRRRWIAVVFADDTICGGRCRPCLPDRCRHSRELSNRNVLRHCTGKLLELSGCRYFFHGLLFGFRVQRASTSTRHFHCSLVV
jgi:hypothetical protein